MSSLFWWFLKQQCLKLDNLDNGNNKKAVQEADRLLKKQKDLLPAKVSMNTSIWLTINCCKYFVYNLISWQNQDINI